MTSAAALAARVAARHPGDDEARRLADMLANADGPRGPGIRTPETLARLKCRNAAIVAEAAGYTGTPAEKGAAMHSRLLRYQQSNWRADQHCEEAPPGRLHLWTILKQGDGDFPGAARLAQIIRENE